MHHLQGILKKGRDKGGGVERIPSQGGTVLGKLEKATLARRHRGRLAQPRAPYQRRQLLRQVCAIERHPTRHLYQEHSLQTLMVIRATYRKSTALQGTTGSPGNAAHTSSFGTCMSRKQATTVVAIMVLADMSTEVFF